MHSLMQRGGVLVGVGVGVGVISYFHGTSGGSIRGLKRASKTQFLAL